MANPDERITVAMALTQPPLPEGGAPGKCALGLLRGLAHHGIDVRALAARRPFALAGEPPTDLPVQIVDVPPEPVGARSHVRAYLDPRGELGRGAFAERFHDLAARADIAHLEETETAPAGRGLSVPSVLHVHYLARSDRDFGAPWRRQFRDVALSSLAEHRAVTRVQHLVASSPEVASLLHRRTGRHVEVVPLSLDPALYTPASLDGPPIAGIIGTAAWPGTRTAIHRLIRRVWPLVRRELPDARLLVAGRGTGHLHELAHEPGVELVGEVESATEWLRGLSVLLFPIDRGSGVKVKVLESLASGVPIVTTPHGAEGLDGGAGVVVETEDAQLARAAVSILRDAGERHERGAAGRAAFLTRYAPEPATLPLVELYRRIAGERP